MHHTAKNAIVAGDKTPGLDSATALNKFRRPLVEYLISGLEVNDKGVRILAVDMLGTSGRYPGDRVLKTAGDRPGSGCPNGCKKITGKDLPGILTIYRHTGR